MSVTNEIIEQSFAPPEFREYQKESLIEIIKGIEDPEVDVVELNAPTGSGKSPVLEGVANYFRNKKGWKSFITTPLNVLVDQLDEDEFFNDRIITLKGRNNYECIHPKDRGKRVDEAICQRDSSFECELKLQCPYYGRKKKAIDHSETVTNMAYLMSEGLIPRHVGMEEWTFDDRNILFLDECQNTEDQATGFISFTVSKRTTPDLIWDNITIPDEDDTDDIDLMVEWISGEVKGAIQHAREQLDRISVLSEDQVKKFEVINEFEIRVDNFLTDVQSNEWVADHGVNFVKRGPNQEKIVFEPVYMDRFLDSLLWKKADNIVLSSATMPPKWWREEIGLGDKGFKRINVPSTFPVENRPIYMGHAVGKMVSERSDSEDNRKTNARPMAEKIKQIAEHHGKDDKGFVHCRSYGIAKLLRMAFQNHGDREWFKEWVHLQDRNNREESLNDWINNDTPLFFSVYMSEGVDLKYDKCQYQILAKTLNPYITKRMKRRQELESNEDYWNYYNLKSVIQLQQAYGRGIRADDDVCVMYVLDKSAKTLIQMNAEMFQHWYLEAIQDMRIDPSRGIGG